MNRFAIAMAVFGLCVAVFCAPPARAQDDTIGLSLVWPDPSAEELEILPRDGCKPLEEIVAPDKNEISALEYETWLASDDGVCWDWYRRNFDRATVVEDRQRQDMSWGERWQVIRNSPEFMDRKRAKDYMKPAGTFAAPVPR